MKLGHYGVLFLSSFFIIILGHNSLDPYTTQAVPNIFAQPVIVTNSFRGSNYQNDYYSDGHTVTTLGLDPYIQNATGQYVPYIISTNTTNINYDSKIFPFSLNKNSCIVTIYDNSKLISNSPSVLANEYWSVAKHDLNTGSWSLLNPFQIQCSSSILQNSTGSYLTVTRSATNIGTFITIYSKVNGQLMKPILSWTNQNSNWSNTSFAFVDNWKGVKLSSFNFNGTNINSTRLLSQNKIYTFTANQFNGKVISFLSNNKNFIYDITNTFSDLSAFRANVTNGNLDLTFLYNATSTPLAVGSTMSRDPTFGYMTSLTVRGATINGVATTKCEPPLGAESTFERLYMAPNGSPNGCRVFMEYWDTTPIPTTAQVSQTNLEIDNSITQNGRNCDFVQITSDPSASSQSTFWNQIDNDTAYVSNSAICNTASNNQVVTLGSTANSDIQNKVTGKYFAVGLRFNPKTTDGLTHDVTPVNIRLQVTYTTLPDIPYQLNSTISTSPLLSWSVPQNNGWPVNGYNGTIWNGTKWITLFPNQTALTYSWLPQGNITQKIRVYTGNHLGWSGGYSFPVNSTLSNLIQEHYAFDYNMHDSAKLRNDGFLGAGLENYSSAHNSVGFIFNGATYVNSTTKTAIQYDRTDHFSISSWVKFSSAGVMATVSKGDCNTITSSTCEFQVFLISGQVYFLIGTDGAHYLEAHEATAINDNSLHNIIVTYNGNSNTSGIKFYIDGVQKTTVSDVNSLSSGTVVNTSGVMFGAERHNGTPDTYYTGILDEVYIISAELNQQQVTDLYNEQLLEPPTVPRNLITTRINATDIHLKWNLPSSNGGSSLTGFKIERSQDTVSWSVLVSNTGNTTGHYDNTGLSSNQKYYYRVSAINSIGTSSPSNVSNNLWYLFVVNEFKADGISTFAGTLSDTNASGTNSYTLSSGSVSIPSLFNNQNFTTKDSSTLFVTNKTNNLNATKANNLTIKANDFYIDCSYTGVGNDFELYTNDTDGHRISLFSTPTCASNSTLKWHVYWSANGKSSSSYTTQVRLKVLNGTYAASPMFLRANNTNYTITYINPYIISANIPVGTGLQNIGIYFDFDPTVLSTTANFTVGSLSISQSNPTKAPITFVRSDPSPSTTFVNVTYPSTYNPTCTVSYAYAQSNKTYGNLTQYTAASFGYVYTPFKFTNSSKDLITMQCKDKVSGQNGTYILTESYGAIPLVSQIKQFQAGKFGTTGQFGVIDIVTLTAVIISFIGLNRVNETSGIIISVMIIGGLAVFQIISWPTILTAAIAVVVMVTVASTKKLPWS